MMSVATPHGRKGRLGINILLGRQTRVKKKKNLEKVRRKILEGSLRVVGCGQDGFQTLNISEEGFLASGRKEREKKKQVVKSIKSGLR